MRRYLDNKWLASGGVIFLALLLILIVVSGERDSRRLEAKKVDGQALDEKLARLAADHSAQLSRLQKSLEQRLAASETRQSELAQENRALKDQLLAHRAALDANDRKLEQAQSQLTGALELRSQETSARLSELRVNLETVRHTNAGLSAQVAKLEAESRRRDEAARDARPR